MGNQPSFSREAKLQWAGSRETNRASGRGRTFFLTSLFIEMAMFHQPLLRPQGSYQPNAELFVRIPSVCAAVLGGVVSPCRWRELAERATMKNPIEAMQIHIECASRGCPLGLQDASVKHLFRHFYRVTMIEVHAVVLILALQTEDHRAARSSVDFISERD